MTHADGWIPLESVLRATGGALAPGSVRPGDAVESSFRGCAIDSRSLEVGELFVPLPGTRADGHAFIAAALRGGAAGSFAGAEWSPTKEALAAKKPIVVVEDPLRALQALGRFARDRASIPVIAVTGSNGKTTTKEMIAAVLGTSRRVHKNVGNLNNHIGVPLTLTRLRPDHEALVVEMGMSARGEIRDLAGLASPTIGVLTNAAAAHLEQLGSIEQVARAKSELAESLPSHGLLVLNADDPLLWAMNRSRALRKRSYALENPEADLRPVRMTITAGGGSQFRLEDGTEVALAILGRHNVRNALAAILVGDELQIPRAKTAEALASLRPARHRLELIQAGGVSVLDDAYNANPASTTEALALLAAMETQGARRAVLGDMLELGPTSESLHESVGRCVPPAAFLYVVGARAEDVARGARAAGVPDARIRRFDDVDAMTSAVLADARPGDLVLVKASRGMRLERVVEALTARAAGATGASGDLAARGRK